MSMSTGVIGIKPPGEKWKKMKAVWDSCADAGIAVPREVSEFFEWDNPDPDGVTVELEKLGCASRLDGCAGFDVDLTRLPKDVKIIRFRNSW